MHVCMYVCMLCMYAMYVCIVWFGMVWYENGMVWCGMEWYGMVCMFCNVCMYVCMYGLYGMYGMYGMYEESFETCFSCVIMFLLIVVWRTLNPKTYRLIVMFFPLKTRHRAWWLHCSCGASTVQLLQRSRPKKLLCITRVWGYPILTNIRQQYLNVHQLYSKKIGSNSGILQSMGVHDTLSLNS